MERIALFVLGDSISMQYGPFLERYLGKRFSYARKTGQEGNLDDARGANGGDSSMVLSYLQALRNAGGLNADVLLLNCGLHDIKVDRATLQRQVLLEDYCSNLRQILSIVEVMNLKVIWVRTTPVVDAVHNQKSTFDRYASDVEKYNAAADVIMTSEGIQSIDLFSFTQSVGDDVYCDHVHFRDEYRRSQAAYIAGWLENWAESFQGAS